MSVMSPAVPVYNKIIKVVSVSLRTSSLGKLVQNYSTINKMETQWQTEKTKLINLSLEEKRKLYKIKDFLPLNSVESWNNYVIKNNSIEKKKPTLDDLTEFKKIQLNNELNKDLIQRVSIFRGDITKLEVDAIVNAANSMLRAGGGVDGAIHRAAGPHLQAECKSLNGCPTGDAKITGGYGLPARYVIHTVGPQDGSPSQLESCYQKSLSLATEEKYNIRSIAFPCISTGIYGFPNRLAAHIALRMARIALEKYDNIERIIFCTFMPVDVDIYETLMQIYFPVHEYSA